jgi:hypothetical protein
MTDTNSTRIFLSHTYDQRPFVREVADELRRRGFDPGAETAELKAGQEVQEQLSQALASSTMFVVFIGKSVDSPWMNFEIGAALGGSKPLLPVFLTEGGRQSAPSVVSKLKGIEAYDLKPDEVAEQIAAAVGSNA